MHHPPRANQAGPTVARGKKRAMTYDTAVWKPANDLLDPNAEFERRFEASEARYPDYREPIPELVDLAEMLDAEFAGPGVWEDLRGSLDGDFVYLTMGYEDG